MHVFFYLLTAKITLFKYLTSPATATVKDVHQVAEASGLGYLPHIHTDRTETVCFPACLVGFLTSASEVKQLKNRNDLVESEDLEHIARAGRHVASA